MSLHSSLRTKPSGLNQHRNVLKRNERIESLSDKEEFDLTEDSPLGLPKVASRLVKVASKKKDEEGEEGAEGLEGATAEEAAPAEGEAG
ncbi:MAG: small basic protein [Phycisphaerales bacterium]|jgi:small basic protein (TIGR04137 family)|nr:small basic protein [Phycisphaerales bacterium]MDP6987054.1 small basic protein [Phycisphaerales bacterium]